ALPLSHEGKLIVLNFREIVTPILFYSNGRRQGGVRALLERRCFGLRDNEDQSIAFKSFRRCMKCVLVLN
ncbi:MAG: hypothetical protein NWP62_02905, partial [Candidatus Planktophila sp.]|nr:hypothetical protein [Candidatus Planktophila sp.]